MAYYEFISTEYITTYTVIPDNIDVNLITKFIRQAQDINIQGVLGHDLYYKMFNDYINTGTTTGEYLTLMNDYIRRAQAEWVVYHSLPFIWARINNKSLVKKESDNTTSTTMDEMKFMRDQIRFSAEYLTERIREYILNNQSFFPEYFTTTGIDRIKAGKQNYFSGIYLSDYNKDYKRPPGYGDPNCCGGY